MTRKEIMELVNIPASSLSDWSKKEDDNWRYKLYIILKNMTVAELEKLLAMGDIDKMSLNEMNNKMHLYVTMEDLK